MKTAVQYLIDYMEENFSVIYGLFFKMVHISWDSIFLIVLQL